MSAAGILAGAGFGDVSNMVGGITAWDGHAPAGAPEAGWTWFAGATGVRELLERAWLIEEGAARFYEHAAERTDGAVSEAFRDLVAAEREHKLAVENLHRRMLGEDPSYDPDTASELIEGGLRLTDALEWLETQSTDTIVEMAMAMEATAFDGYAQLARLADNPEEAKAFGALADGERHHLAEVTALFTKLAA